MELSNFNTGNMEQDELIEMQIWEFVDGLCPESDHARIALLIHTDPVWEAKYAEISALNSSIKSTLDLEQPSLRFAKNVMEQVAHTRIAPATHNYINKRIIMGIAAIFVAMLGSMLVYAAMHTQWNTSSVFSMSILGVKSVNYSSLFKGNYAFVAVAINVVLALVLVDKMLQHRGRNNTRSA